jgi:hypothetical protein
LGIPGWFAGCESIVHETGKSETCVWRWQERFAAEGFEGLLRDKTRPSRIKKLEPSIAQRAMALTMEPPLAEATHWTGAAMADAAGVSVSSVQRIWRAHGLQSHRGRQFKLSKDPEFVDKLRDGLYVDPRAHAVVLSVDEKSQSRPSIARPPGLPMKKGRAGTVTHDDKRHGTTTLFAAMLGALERDAGSALAPPARLRRPTTDPRRGPRKDHVVLLREAEKQVDMAAYVLTDAVIEALRDASTRGGEGTGLARRERGGVLLQTAR